MSEPAKAKQRPRGSPLAASQAWSSGSIPGRNSNREDRSFRVKHQLSASLAVRRQSWQSWQRIPVAVTRTSSRFSGRVLTVQCISMGWEMRSVRPARFFACRLRMTPLWALPAASEMPLLDDDRALHVGVELAEVLECPGRVEFLRERFALGDRA